MGVISVINKETKAVDSDHRHFKELIRFLDAKGLSATSRHEIIIEVGRFFLGSPYAVGTLEGKGTEHLVVNLREFDCMTFVESVLALTYCVTFGRESFGAFRTRLLKLRYKQGRLNGYCSRLHYFSDWIEDNRRKGIVKKVTAELGGRALRKKIDFMTTHPDLYPLLKEEVNLLNMRCVERAISQRKLYTLPKEILKEMEDRILDGDIIAITTRKGGIDVLHVGLAARLRGRVHLLHASAKEGKVTLSKQTLYRYLMENKTRSGIMVARVV
jgi:hypothetical protein